MQKLRRHFPYLALVLVLYSLLAFAIAYVNDWHERPFSHFSDLNMHLAYAAKLTEPGLFARDPVFSSYDWRQKGRIDVLPFPLFLSVLMPLLGGIRPTLVVLSLFLGLMFVVGIYVLTYYLSGDALAGVIASFLASLPYWALGGVQLGFLPESVLPRNMTMAISPTILYLFFKWKNRDRLWILYAFLGLCLYMHILSALHLATILTLTLILANKGSWPMVKRVLLAGMAFVVVVVPAALVFLPSLTSVLTVTSGEAQVETTRYAFALRPDLATLIAFVQSFFPLAVVGGLGLSFVRKQRASWDANWREYSILCLIVLLLPWVGVAINAVTVSFRQLELLRVTRYYFVLSFAPASVLLSHWLQKRGLRHKVLVPVLLVVLVFLTRMQVNVAIVRRGYQWLGLAQEASTETKQVDAHLQVTWDWEAFRDLCLWVDSNTAIDAMFLAPADWSSFWVYARRGMVATWKDSGTPRKYERYVAVSELYRHPQAASFVEAASQYRVDYIIVAHAVVLPQLERVYQNEYYAVYKANGALSRVGTD